MKRPHPAGTPIDMRRYRKWLHEFTSYRYQITDLRIQLWLNQFMRKDRDLAARILDCVDFINHEQISTAFRELLSGIDGWSTNKAERRGEWRFVAYSASAGESGDEMLHKFRVANNLALKKYDDLFIYKSDLMRANLGNNDTVIFIDDFSGSGDQVCDSWSEIQELLPGEPRVFLILIAASNKAVKRISRETEISCVPHKMLKDQDCIFSDKCCHFNHADQVKVLEYCTKADKNNPKGYGDCGFLLVFSHTCPNNSIPILHKSANKWEGLFRRYD